MALGGVIAAMPGMAVQAWHSRRERSIAVKKIQSLLKAEFEELYKILIEERDTATKAGNSTKDFDRLKNRKMDISEYLEKVGGIRLQSLAWDAIISSENLIKLDNNEIEIIQSVHHSVKLYNKNMN